MSSWRLAKSLVVLKSQVNAAFPGRDRSSDGSIGDSSHSARASDHNPNGAGVVTAIDIDADLSPTENVGILVAALVAARDPRIKYIIWNRRITVKGDISKWKPYSGANAHQHHAHISVSANAALYDDDSPWKLKFDSAAECGAPAGVRDLRAGTFGDDVRKLQAALNLTADGKFGPKTEAAVKAFQLAHDLNDDGIAGRKTRAALGL